MKAAVIREHGGPGSISIDNAFPDPVAAPDEVVVRVKAVALNRQDVLMRNGLPGLKLPLPAIAGLDFAGEIAGRGANVKTWRQGQRVLIDPIDHVGHGGRIGEARAGGLAEYCAVPAQHLVPLEENVSYEAAACLPMAYGSAMRMLYTIGELKKGEKILILGASGGVGSACVQLAKLVGAEVIACVSREAKLSLLEQLGAEHRLVYSKNGLVKWLHDKFGEPHPRKFTGGVDAVVNCIGGDTWTPLLSALRRQGRVLTCGATAAFNPKTDIRRVAAYELKIFGSSGWLREDLITLLDLVAAGRLTPVIGRELPLEQVNEAFRLLESRASFGKTVLKP